MGLEIENIQEGQQLDLNATKPLQVYSRKKKSASEPRPSIASTHSPSFADESLSHDLDLPCY